MNVVSVQYGIGDWQADIWHPAWSDAQFTPSSGPMHVYEREVFTLEPVGHYHYFEVWSFLGRHRTTYAGQSWYDALVAVFENFDHSQLQVLKGTLPVWMVAAAPVASYPALTPQLMRTSFKSIVGKQYYDPDPAPPKAPLFTAKCICNDEYFRQNGCSAMRGGKCTQ